MFLPLSEEEIYEAILEMRRQEEEQTLRMLSDLEQEELAERARDRDMYEAACLADM